MFENSHKLIASPWLQQHRRRQNNLSNFRYKSNFPPQNTFLDWNFPTKKKNNPPPEPPSQEKQVFNLVSTVWAASFFASHFPLLYLHFREKKPAPPSSRFVVGRIWHTQRKSRFPSFPRACWFSSLAAWNVFFPPRVLPFSGREKSSNWWCIYHNWGFQ